MQKIKLEAENDLEKRCKNLKEQNEALISGLDLANETISNLYGLLREYRQQKEKLLKQNNFVLKACKDKKIPYVDYLIYRKGYVLSKEDQNFIECLKNGIEQVK